MKFTWVRSCHKSGCVFLSKEIQKDSGQVDLYLAFENQFQCRRFKTCFFFDPKFLQIHLMPAQGKHLQYEPCRDYRVSNSDVCHHRPRETKNRGIAWNYGSALYNVCLLFWWLCGAVLWWVVGFGFGKLEKSSGHTHFSCGSSN